MRIGSVENTNCHNSDHPNFLPPLAAAPVSGCQGKMGFKSSGAARDSVLQDSTQAELEIQGKTEIGRAPWGTWTKLLLRQGQVQSQSTLHAAPEGLQGWRCQGLPGQNCFPWC